MAEKINTNVFGEDKKFVDFAGLDYFWEKAKGYVDGVDQSLSQRITANADAIAGLTGGESSVGAQVAEALAEAKSYTDGKDSAMDARVDVLEGRDVYVAADVTSAINTAASGALSDAKSYTDDALVDAKSYADQAEADALAAAKAYADGLDTAMNTRVVKLEAIDHDKLAADASAAAVATVLDGAPEKFDTLKEVAQWIADSESAATAADLVTRVAALEAIDHDAYVDADATVLASAKSYADGLASNYDAAGSAATAKSEAIATAAADATSKANAAQAAAEATAAADATSKANAAKADAIAQAKADTAETLKSYYTKTETDNLLSTNSEGDRAYAKQYTDELFSSIKFATNSDIDSLFA